MAKSDSRPRLAASVVSSLSTALGLLLIAGGAGATSGQSLSHPWTVEPFPAQLDAPRTHSFVTRETFSTCSQSDEFTTVYAFSRGGLGRKLRVPQPAMHLQPRDPLASNAAAIYQWNLRDSLMLAPVIDEIASISEVNPDLLKDLINGSEALEHIKREFPPSVPVSGGDFEAGLGGAWWVSKLTQFNGRTVVFDHGSGIRSFENVTRLAGSPREGFIKARLWRDQALFSEMSRAARNLLSPVSSRVITCVRVASRDQWEALRNSECPQCLTPDDRKALVQMVQERTARAQERMTADEVQVLSQAEIARNRSAMSKCQLLTASSLAAEALWTEDVESSPEAPRYIKYDTQVFRRGLTSVWSESEKLALEREQTGGVVTSDLWACHQNDGMM